MRTLMAGEVPTRQRHAASHLPSECISPITVYNPPSCRPLHQRTLIMADTKQAQAYHLEEDDASSSRRFSMSSLLSSRRGFVPKDKTYVDRTTRAVTCCIYISDTSDPLQLQVLPTRRRCRSLGHGQNPRAGARGPPPSTEELRYTI